MTAAREVFFFFFFLQDKRMSLSCGHKLNLLKETAVRKTIPLDVNLCNPVTSNARSLNGRERPAGTRTRDHKSLSPCRPQLIL